MKKGWLMKFSLLSISLVLTSAGAITGNIPAMSKTFSNEPLSSVEMLTTIPSLMIVVFVLLSSFVSKKIGSKQTVLLGLTIAFISGLVPVFISSSFIVILISRAGLGIGFGLFNSLAVSLISDFFEGDIRAQLIGFQSAFQGLGTAILTFAAGELLKIDWPDTFWIYAVILPIFVLFILFVPDPEKENKKNIDRFSVKRIQKIDVQVINYILFLFIMVGIYMASQVELALLFTSRGYGSATEASNVISIMSIASMLTGFSFRNIFKLLNQFTLPVSVMLISLSCILLALSNNVLFSAIGCILNGISFSLFVPYIFNRISTVPTNFSRTFSTSLLLVGANLGYSLSPYIFRVIGNIASSNSIKNTFLIESILTASMAIIGTIFVINKLHAGVFEEN
ncbi:MFS transporter [Oenococcus oeni]|uniref:MFS transporter n=1 Tax=Oenococcus oeni TaxID=1247 RepID=UPI00067BC27E|nr:MFS transporter [Oenococcus oeni]